MTTSGRSRSSFFSSAAASVTSSSARPKPTTTWPALPAASITSRPSIPAAPATSSFTAPPPLDDFDLGLVADQQAQRLRHAVAAGQLHFAAEQAGLHAGAEVLDHGAGEDDRVLDLGAADVDAVADRGVGADVGVLDAGAGADHGGAADDRAGDGGSLLDDHPALDLGVVDVALEPGLYLLEHQAVGLEHVGELTGVLPPA